MVAYVTQWCNTVRHTVRYNYRKATLERVALHLRGAAAVVEVEWATVALLESDIDAFDLGANIFYGNVSKVFN